jgi:hypothetical protein
LSCIPKSTSFLKRLFLSAFVFLHMLYVFVSLLLCSRGNVFWLSTICHHSAAVWKWFAWYY